MPILLLLGCLSRPVVASPRATSRPKYRFLHGLPNGCLRRSGPRSSAGIRWRRSSSTCSGAGPTVLCWTRGSGRMNGLAGHRSPLRPQASPSRAASWIGSDGPICRCRTQAGTHSQRGRHAGRRRGCRLRDVHRAECVGAPPLRQVGAVLHPDPGPSGRRAEPVECAAVERSEYDEKRG